MLHTVVLVLVLAVVVVVVISSDFVIGSRTVRTSHTLKIDQSLIVHFGAGLATTEGCRRSVLTVAAAEPAGPSEWCFIPSMCRTRASTLPTLGKISSQKKCQPKIAKRSLNVRFGPSFGAAAFAAIFFFLVP